MAVFTTVSESEASEFLKSYDLGEFVSLRGISSGIENTNYFLTTTKGEFVLTIFEVLTFSQLPFYIELMHHLASKQIPVPQPQTKNDGQRISTLHGKPSAIVTRLPGNFVASPSVAHCALAGKTLAQTHLAGQDFEIDQPNLRGYTWWEQTAPTVMPFLDSNKQELLQKTLLEQRSIVLTTDWKSLPLGPSHCDLFRDNVLFSGSIEHPVMGGFIDFYFAGCDKWIFDVAVCINDWCIDHANGKLIPDLTQAWLSAYSQVRPFTDQEIKLWPIVLRAAALRFWLSRLYDFYLPRPAQTLKAHDPGHFERVLLSRHTDPIPALLKDY